MASITAQAETRAQQHGEVQLSPPGSPLIIKEQRLHSPAQGWFEMVRRAGAIIVAAATLGTAGCAPAVVLQLQKVQCDVTFASSLISARGEVTNISRDRLYDVQAVVKFLGVDRTVLEQRTSYIDPLSPGQTTRFEVLTMARPAFSECDVGFQTSNGKPVLHRESWFGAGLNRM